MSTQHQHAKKHRMPVQLAGKAAYFIAHEKGRPAIAVRCSVCQAVRVGSDKVNAPPVRIAKHFTDCGWDIVREGVSATCPECQKKPRSAPSTTLADDPKILESLRRQQLAEERRLAALPQPEPTPAEATIDPQPEESDPMTSAAAATPAAILAQHKLFALLADHFDKERGKYDDGYDDRRLAKETGLALSEVAKVREVICGPLVDPRVAELRKAIADVDAKGQKAIAELRAMVEVEAQAHQDRVAGLARQLAELEGRRAA